MKEMNNDQINSGVKKFRTKAKEYIQDKEKTKKLLLEVGNKAKAEKGRIQSFKDQLFLLIEAYEDWSSGSYKEIPYKSLAMIVIGLLYFIVPTDLIPDILLGAGLIDDAAILSYIIKQVGNDLEKYKLWKKSINNSSISSNINE